MALFSHNWTLGVLLLISFIFTTSFPVNTYGTQANNEGDSKVKCKQHIEEALRQYWDTEKGAYVQITDDTDPAILNASSIEEDSDENESDEEIAPSAESTEQGDDNDESSELENSQEKNQVSENSSQGQNSAEDISQENSTEDDDDNDEDDSKEDEEEISEETVEQDDDKSVANETEEAASDEKDDSSEPEEITTENADQSEEDNSAESKETDSDNDSQESNEAITESPVVNSNSEPPIEKVESVSTVFEPESEESEEELDNNSNQNSTDSGESEEEEIEHFRSRSQIEDILKLYEIGTKEDRAEQQLILSIFRDLKRIYETAIRPMETLYKYRDITTRLITDAEIFSKPLVMFMGAKSSGKTSLVNYLLGLESTPLELKTGLDVTSPHFTVLEYGDNFTQLTPSEIAADFGFSNLQQFGQRFVREHLQAYRMPLSILQRITIVDSPGLIEGILTKSPEPGKAIDSEVYQWFVDRSDIIYIVIDISQVYLTQSLQSLLEQLKGRDVRFLITKSDMVTQTQCIMLIGQLLWMLSPVMPSDRPPQVHAITTSPSEVYNAFLDAQEQEWLGDMSDQISGIARIESRVASLRRHAVRVRNHAKLVDCYLATYYKKKGFFTWGAAAKKIALEITENPHQYSIFSGAVVSHMQNISRYDLPDPAIYREFFRTNPLPELTPLSSTCSFLKGCPIDKLDVAIAYQLPDLVSKYKKLTRLTKN